MILPTANSKKDMAELAKNAAVDVVREQARIAEVAKISTARQLQVTGEQYRFTRSPGADLLMLSKWRKGEYHPTPRQRRTSPKKKTK